MKNLLLLALCFFASSPAFSQSFPTSTSQPASSQPATQPTAWKLSREKTYPLYKVQIFVKENPASPLGIDSGKIVILDQQGKIVYQTLGLFFEVDPAKFFSNPPQTPLDFDRDGSEDLIIRNFSGGAHCCYSYQFFSLAKTLKNLGTLKLLDCGEQLNLKDLNQDGNLEILTCNPLFTYLPKIPYTDSPFPPMVWGLEKEHWTNQDSKYPQVFYSDIEERKKELTQNNYNRSDILQIVADYLLTAHEAEAWKTLDLITNLNNKDEVREEFLKRLQQYKQSYLLNTASSQPASQPNSEPSSQPSSKPARTP